MILGFMLTKNKLLTTEIPWEIPNLSKREVVEAMGLRFNGESLEEYEVCKKRL
jgi:hypothetical protein